MNMIQIIWHDSFLNEVSLELRLETLDLCKYLVLQIWSLRYAILSPSKKELQIILPLWAPNEGVHLRIYTLLRTNKLLPKLSMLYDKTITSPTVSIWLYINLYPGIHETCLGLQKISFSHFRIIVSQSYIKKSISC